MPFGLFQKGDENNLLELHSAKVVSAGCEGKVKIFNAYILPTQDHQIGDRRWRNAFVILFSFILISMVL